MKCQMTLLRQNKTQNKRIKKKKNALFSMTVILLTYQIIRCNFFFLSFLDLIGLFSLV